MAKSKRDEVKRKEEATKKPAKKSMPKAPVQNRKKMVEDDGY